MGLICKVDLTPRHNLSTVVTVFFVQLYVHQIVLGKEVVYNFSIVVRFFLNHQVLEKN